MRVLLLVFFFFPLFSLGDESSAFYGAPKTKKKKIEPVYEACKSQDISSLSEETSLEKKTEGEFCFSCIFTNPFGFGEMQETAQTLQTKVFREKLQKRVIGQIESKIYQIQSLQACVRGDREWFRKQKVKVDWPLMKEVCKKKTKKLRAAIKERWSEMRLNLALSSPAIDEGRILSKNSTWFDSTPSHLISDFTDLPRLSLREKTQARKRYVETLAQAPLSGLSSSEFKRRMYRGKTLHSGKRQLTPEDRRELRKAAGNLQEEARMNYLEITSEMPLLGYLKTGNPGQRDLSEAFLKMEGKLEDLLDKAKDEEGDMGLLLSFKPLVEELLKEDKSYCLAAEGARIEAEKNESLKDWAMMGVGVAAAVPCFIAGPIGATACLTAGMALGIWGYKEAEVAKGEALGRVLTGKEFETMAGLTEKEREEFLAKLFLPLGAWGTTAVPARAASGAFTKAVKGAKVKTGVGKRAETQTDSTDAKVALVEKPHISPEDVHIKQIGHNTNTQSDIFQVKFTSQNGKEIQLELEIPTERLEQNKLDIEELIEEVIEDEKFDPEFNAENFAALVREEQDLLFYVKRLISSLSEESVQKGNKINLKELEAMAVSQYRNRTFQHFVQNYSRQHNSNLNHIGVKNVHIKKIDSDERFTEYEVQFKTRRGKRMSLKLKIAKQADGRVTSDEHVLEEIKANDFYPSNIAIHTNILNMQQRMQLAIGQMPAEIFKGLKSINLNPNSGNIGGQTMELPPGAVRFHDNKGPPKYVLSGPLRHLTVRLPVNESVMHAWLRVTKSTKSHMNLYTARLDEIPFSNENDLTSTLAHELGHVLQHTRYAIPTVSKLKDTEGTIEQLDRMISPKGWPEAIKKDGTSISEYGDTRLVEDFAEAMRVYIQTDGGAKDPQALRNFANRFEILDELMQASMTERKSLFDRFKKAMEKRGIAFVTRAGVLTHVVVQDQVYIIPPAEDISTPDE